MAAEEIRLARRSRPRRACRRLPSGFRPPARLDLHTRARLRIQVRVTMVRRRKERPARAQVAALPYRLGEDGNRLVMLVTSRETKRWVTPKGWPMKDVNPHRTAEREAH